MYNKYLCRVFTRYLTCCCMLMNRIYYMLCSMLCTEDPGSERDRHMFFLMYEICTLFNI